MSINNTNKIREAGKADAAAILEIYTPYIEHTSITFETETPSIQAFGKRIDEYLQTWPWLVYTIGGVVAGYAYASKYRERLGYQWCVECSVYVADEHQNKGVAKALYAALIKLLTLQGYRNLYAVINLPNDRSVAFHEKLHFTHFANFDKVGYKLGHWKTVGWWLLQLNEYMQDPAPPKAYQELLKDAVEAIFASSL